MFVLTFSPSGEKVNTNMVLVHREVKMSTLGKIVNNHLDNIPKLREPLKNLATAVFFHLACLLAPCPAT